MVLIGNSMGGPVCLEVAHSAPKRVAGIVLASPAGGMHNQPLARALMQLVRDVRRESPRMARVVLPDYLHFGPVNALQLFGELVRFPSLERILRTPPQTAGTVAALLTLREHVSAPILAGVRSPRRGRKPATWSNVDRDYEKIRTDMRTLFQDLGIRAAG